ncbi:MAG TPA: PUA domain-containing protein, partial [Kofleriaceae bacterium]|nr:PUA domain-containing protein [Kofleriaceae bacterium]
EPGVLVRVLAGEDVGTLFVPAKRELSARKHWIAYGSKPVGTIAVDAGAARAITQQQRSLLPAGITDVTGEFESGDTISIAHDGKEIARGLVAYGAAELRAIKGMQSSAIAAKLGVKSAEEAVHRDDLVLL